MRPGDTPLTTTRDPAIPEAIPESVWNVANAVYALHSIAIAVGVLGSATVVLSFIGSVPSIAAVILNYVKQADARGSWIESHYRWQIRTFWYAVGWVLLGALLFVTVIGIPLAIAVWAGATLWVVYRILRGWLRLRDRLPMEL